MRRAVIISPNPSISAGGVERVCALVGRVLEEDQWIVDIVGPPKRSPQSLSRLGLGYLATSLSATQAACVPRPDLLITNGLLGMSRLGGPPRIHIFHGTMVADTRAEGPELSRRERVRRSVGGGLAEALAGRRSTVVCVSEGTAREVRRYYGVKTDAVIPNCVDTAVFHPRPTLQARDQLGLPATGRYCLFVGRIQHRKGSDLLLPACRAAGFELLIAGAGRVQGARHLGKLAPDALAHAYAAADCVVFPTRYEGFGLVALEAIACRRPLLMTKVGWLPTLLQAVPGYEALCIEPDVQHIAERLLTLDRLNLDDLTGRAREFVLENNSLERYREHWEELLGRLHL